MATMASHLPKYSGMVFSSNVYKVLGCRNIVTASKFKTPSTINPEEVKKFENTSDKWWNGSSYSLLQVYNSVRVPLIRDGILSVSKNYRKVAKPLEGYSILDVGCGGGILSEPLARLGAEVTGLDPGAKNIQVAIEHASKDLEIKDNITYMCDTVENAAATENKYDAVVASEVIEHVNDVSLFVQSCVKLTKSNGSLFFTSINKTYLSYLQTILFAEYVLKLVPQGTHEWNKFVKPKDLFDMLESLNCRIVSLEGIVFNPITNKFSWCKNIDNLYALHAVKL